MIISIVLGSTREGRNSYRLALALQNQITALGHQAEIIDPKELNFPIFTERLALLAEKPPVLVEISARLQQSNGLIFLTPEYNGSFSSVLKAFIDTFGRAEFGGKPIGVATASTGIMGGMRAAQQLQQVILAIQAYPQPQMLLGAEINKQLDADGQLINPAFQTKIDAFVNAFIKFAARF